MTDDQVKHVADTYRARLEREGYGAHRIDFDRTTASFPKSRQLEHACWLCGEILEALAAGERERAMRHFGFVQGVLWAHGVYAISEMKEQNRAPSE